LAPDNNNNNNNNNNDDAGRGGLIMEYSDRRCATLPRHIFLEMSRNLDGFFDYLKTAFLGKTSVDILLGGFQGIFLELPEELSQNFPRNFRRRELSLNLPRSFPGILREFVVQRWSLYSSLTTLLKRQQKKRQGICRRRRAPAFFA